MKRLLSILILLLSQLDAEQSWAEKTLQTMTFEEKIGQIFMVAGYVNKDFANDEKAGRDIDGLVCNYHVGGVCLVGPSNSSDQVLLLNRLQQLGKYPLLVAQDLEWGLSMRLQDGMRFLKNITLGTLQDNSLIYEMGKEIARQATLVGVHMNLSPDIDVNIEPENPAINVRSFGASPQNVAEKGVAMIQGLQDGGIIASAKHFPGLGDIAIDPHLALPANLHDKKRLEAVELYPFYEAVKAGVGSIQVDHVLMPALDDAVSSLSSVIVQGILKDKMGFKGLVLSGALRMKALTTLYSQEYIAKQAFLAGNDMLLMPEDFVKSYEAVKTLILENKQLESVLDERVLKILTLKEQCRLHENRLRDVPTEDALHTNEAKALKKRLYEQVVVLERDGGVCPKPTAYVQIGGSKNSLFYEELTKSYLLTPFFCSEDELYNDLPQQLEEHSGIILAVYPIDPRKIAEVRLLPDDERVKALKHFRVHGISPQAQVLLQQLEKYQAKTIVCFFGNPFGLAFVQGYSTLINGFENDPDAEERVVTLLKIQEKICGNSTSK